MVVDSCSLTDTLVGMAIEGDLVGGITTASGTVAQNCPKVRGSSLSGISKCNCRVGRCEGTSLQQHG